MNERFLLRLEIEDFLYQEAAYLDAWRLQPWLGLFSPQGRYEIAPTGDDEADTLEAAESLFLVADDRQRLEQRVIRLLKPSAHAEYPHSRVRRLYSNVRITGDADGTTQVASNFVTFRTKRNITSSYIGHHLWHLEREAGELRIALKRCVLDLDSLVPQGKISLIL